MCDHIMKAIEQYFHVVYYVAQGGSKALVCDHSNESCSAVLSCGAVYYMYNVLVRCFEFQFPSIVPLNALWTAVK